MQMTKANEADVESQCCALHPHIAPTSETNRNQELTASMTAAIACLGSHAVQFPRVDLVNAYRKPTSTLAAIGTIATATIHKPVVDCSALQSFKPHISAKSILYPDVQLTKECTKHAMCYSQMDSSGRRQNEGTPHGTIQMYPTQKKKKMHVVLRKTRTRRFLTFRFDPLERKRRLRNDDGMLVMHFVQEDAFFTFCRGGGTELCHAQRCF